MSASAGKVMPRPMGDYNALTEYKILDIVTYNDRPYMAKQTTQGNLPTNTTYWMLLLDFPTEVDNVPTQNSNNLVKSGGVYSSVANKVETDFNNVNNIVLGGQTFNEKIDFLVGNITKPSGDNQDVTIVVTYSNDDGEHFAILTEESLKPYIGNPKVWFYSNRLSGDPVYVNLSSVTRSTTTVTAVGKLVTDSTAAIDFEGAALYGPSDASGYYNIINGKGSIGNSYARTSGDCCVANGTASVAEGRYCVAKGDYSHALGCGAQAKAYQSTALGYYTEAGYQNQVVMGTYNANRGTNYLEVGGGTASTRKNVFEVATTGHISCNDGTDKYKFAKKNGVDGFYDGSNNFHPFTGYKELVNNSVVTSTSADVDVTFSDASITADSTIEPFVSVWGINPKNVVASAGQCVVTIPKQSSSSTIGVKIRVS